MIGFLGDPTSPLTKPEKPDFFLKTLPILGSLVSSEKRLGGGTALSITLVSPVFSLATGYSVGLGWAGDGLMINVSVFALIRGGGWIGLVAGGGW